ncbi:MAG: hypothetical protein KatS3mg023_0625 [Armatimonadota bacterium]|nr:MAG: hypothetical protein KatS3mg023_0625 [Armatimonadota bacterium]
MSSTTYRLTCLSPVHIGTGQQWSKFDGAYHEGRWYVVDLDRVFALGVDGNELAQAMSSGAFSWAEWLRGRRISPEQVALYSLPCALPPGEVYIREGIKDVYLRPYIPATTLKGAVRTAIVWYLLRHDEQAQAFTRRYLILAVYAKDIGQIVNRLAKGNRQAEEDPQLHLRAIREALELDDAQEAEAFLQTLYRALGKHLEGARRGDRYERVRMRDIRELGSDRRFLALPVERYLLGKDPNHDLLRVLQVGDSETTSLEQMEVGLVWTYHLNQSGRLQPKREQGMEYKSLAEWLKPETSVRLSLRIDESLLGEQANKVLKFKPTQQQAIRRLPEVCNSYARSVIGRQKEYVTRHHQPQLQAFYNQLQQRLDSLPGGAFLLNIGWGGGWEAKTVGDIVQEILHDDDYDDFGELRKRYKLGENPQTNRINPDAPFPETRLVAYQGAAAAYPLGWVLLEPEKG